MFKDFIQLIWLVLSIVPATIISLIRELTPTGKVNTTALSITIAQSIIGLFADETPPATPTARKPRAKKKP